MPGPWRRYAELHHGHGHTVTGEILVAEGIHGDGIPARDILVLLPASFETAPLGTRWPVLYLFDGQNLFDAATSFAGEWEVDETMAELAFEGIEAFVVGLPNGGHERVPEYTPWRTSGARVRGGTGRGGATLAWITDEVKPLVDAGFPTMPGRETTLIGGSSLGGLMAAHAGAARSDVFGLVLAMSPALKFGQGEPLLAAIARRPAPLRAWVDVGTEEETVALARAYVEWAGRLADTYAARGLREGDGLRFVVEEGARHHESAWARRLPDALRFLLGG